MSVPAKAHNRISTISLVSRERGTRSLDLTTPPRQTCTTTSGIDLGSSLTDKDPATSNSTQEVSGISKAESKHGVRSVFGSIKLRLTRGHAESNAARRALSVVKSISEDLPHDPGDRYPTTALTAPSAYQLDEVCSHFSEDSSERERRAHKGHRWTTARNKQRAAPSAVNDMLYEHMSYDAGAINVARYGSHSAAATYLPPSLNIARAESQMKRFGEKIRHLLCKGGELLRSLSTRSRIQRSRATVRHNEWLEDSLYSGV